MAAQIISTLVDKSTENLADHGLIDDTAKVRYVGADTRQLERHQAQLRAATLGNFANAFLTSCYVDHFRNTKRILSLHFFKSRANFCT